MFKHYGLAGKQIKVRHKNGHVPAYPWNGIAVPVLVIEEHPGYLAGLVLKHQAPGGFGPSIPYRINLNKFDIEHGVFIIEGI